MEVVYALDVSVFSWSIMVKRRFFFLFMLVAAWIPVQFVAAWQSMTEMEWQRVASFVAPVQAAEMSMTAHAGGMDCDGMGMVGASHDGATLNSSDISHVSVHVGGGCSTFCFGIPPAVVPLAATVSAPVMVPYLFHASLYQDFIPGVLSPPPVYSLS